MVEYNDKTPMPFGQHIGARLEEVPAQYLLYLYGKDGSGIANEQLRAYIAKNLNVLGPEAKKERAEYFKNLKHNAR